MLAGACAKNIVIWRNRAFAGQLSATACVELGRFGQKTHAGWYKYDETEILVPIRQSPTLFANGLRSAEFHSVRF